MSAWLRASKVRNVGASIGKPHEFYSEISPGQIVGDMNMLSASTEHLAYVHSSNSGSLAVLPLASTGRLTFDSHHHLSILSHSAAVAAFEFSPHDPHSLLSLSADGNVNVFSTGDIFTGGDDDGISVRRPMKSIQVSSFL